MAVLKCKMCGGSLEVQDGVSVCECEYCGSKQTVPKVENEVITNLFNRANNLRLKCEFDKAEQIYEKIVEQDDSEAEAHWGIVLCKYGIEYVEDPKTFKRIPTCHRTLFDAVTKDTDYQAAIDYADTTQQVIYESEARQIDRIQKHILEVVKNEKPFDVFICYKETDEAGKRTIDSTLANDIYYQLTQEGLKVFYAAITLEDKLGQEYEPYIFAALNSAKVMLVIGTKPEYFTAVWVRNEWSRFMNFMKTDRSKLLIPCYRDMDAYDLPEEFAHLQAQDMSKIGFVNDVVRGIKKVAQKEDEQPKTETVILNANNASTEPLLERVFMFLEDGKWQDADLYCEKVLDIDPKSAEAYLGKLMAELQVKHRKGLADCTEPFDDRDNYSKILRFGDEILETEMRGYTTHINERNENARLSEIYRNAENEMQKAQSEDEYLKVANTFSSISGFNDADLLRKQCIEKAAYEKKRIDAIAIAIRKKLNDEKSISQEDGLKELKLEKEKLIKVLNEFDSVANELCTEAQIIHVYNNKIAELQSIRNALGIFAGKEKKAIDIEITEVATKKTESENKAKELSDVLCGFSSKSEIEGKIVEIENSIKYLNKEIENAKDSAISEISFEEALQELKNEKILQAFKSDYGELYKKYTLLVTGVGEK